MAKRKLKEYEHWERDNIIKAAQTLDKRHELPLSTAIMLLMQSHESTRKDLIALRKVHNAGCEYVWQKGYQHGRWDEKHRQPVDYRSRKKVKIVG